MDFSRPLSAVAASLHGDVLTALARSNRPLSGRAVARAAGKTTHSAVAKVLQSLVATGLVLRSDHGSTALYELNRRHLAAEAVELLAGTRNRLVERTADLLASGASPPVAVALFGSVARGDSGAASDIDVLVVLTDTPDDGWPTARADLTASVAAWTGNPVNLVEFTVTEWQAAVNAGDRFAGEILRDALDVFGQPVRRIARPNAVHA